MNMSLYRSGTRILKRGMYPNEDTTGLSGVKNIIDAGKQKEFLEAVAGKSAFVSDDGPSIDFVPQYVYLLNGDECPH